jgi:hypothetical protein
VDSCCTIIGGGFCNISNPNTAFGFIGGGDRNKICCPFLGSSLAATVSGGSRNVVCSNYGTVGGGAVNCAGTYATVGGGSSNTASGVYAVVAGGFDNCATGRSSAVIGGQSTKALNCTSLAFGASSCACADYAIAMGCAIVAGTACTAFFNNICSCGIIRTSAPSGGTAANWKLGTVATVSPTSPNRTIEVEIGGTTYYLHAKTTNN